MSLFGGRTSAEVAEEAEHERADLAHTLDQLRENLQPRNVVDEVMTQAGVNPANVSERMMQLVRLNPVAAALIGIGAAMLLGVGRRSAKAPEDRRWATVDRFPSAASPNARINPEVRRDTPGNSRRYEEGVAARPGAARSVASADRSPFTLSNDYSARPAMNNVSIIKHPRASLSRLFDEQPLVLAALGVAVGAAVGSALPSTEIESGLMGDASESVRQNASAAARQQLAQLKATAGQTFEQMKATAAEHGATSDNLSGLVHDLGDDVRTGTSTVKEQANDLRFRA